MKTRNPLQNAKYSIASWWRASVHSLSSPEQYSGTVPCRTPQPWWCQQYLKNKLLQDQKREDFSCWSEEVAMTFSSTPSNQSSRNTLRQVFPHTVQKITLTSSEKTTETCCVCTGLKSKHHLRPNDANSVLQCQSLYSVASYTFTVIFATVTECHFRRREEDGSL